MQDRTRAAIVEAAIRVLADEGLSAKLDTVAVEAGVSRATLYRHFSSREELIGALFDAAYGEVVESVRGARLDDIDFAEGLARVSRAAAHTGKHFVVLQNDEVPVSRPHHLDEEFEGTMDRLFERGKEQGCLRPELATPWLRQVFRYTVIAALRHGSMAGLGVEETGALIVDHFLAGAGAQDSRGT